MTLSYPRIYSRNAYVTKIAAIKGNDIVGETISLVPGVNNENIRIIKTTVTIASSIILFYISVDIFYMREYILTISKSTMTSVQQLGYVVSAPSALTANPGTVPGALDTLATYQYKVTYVTGFGETDGGSNASVVTTSTGSVNLTAIPISANGNVIARKIYRTVGGGGSWLLLVLLSDNVTTSYVDIIADGSLGAAIPVINTAGSVQQFLGIVQLGTAATVSVENNITATAGGAQVGAYPLTNNVSVITVVASGNDSVILPGLTTNLVGKKMTIKNLGANTARIYPAIGQQINLGGADVPITIAASAVVNLVANTSSNWITI